MRSLSLDLADKTGCNIVDQACYGNIVTKDRVSPQECDIFAQRPLKIGNR